MKIKGSQGLADSLFGGKGADIILGYGEGDLISAWGGSGVGAKDKVYAGGGNDLISGFEVNFSRLSQSDSRGAMIDGGSGYDMLIVDAVAGPRKTDLSKIDKVLDIHKVEEIIYNFGDGGPKQTFYGSNNGETIYVGNGGTTVNGGGGNDYLFAGSGDDVLVGGGGNDFISGGDGLNTLTGGKGRDYFQFHITEGYGYSNITDFQKGVDKIALTIDLRDYTYEPDTFGDDFRLLNRKIDSYGYLDYDSGRSIDRSQFTASNQHYNNSVIYERSTGSVIQSIYIEEDDGIVRYDILVAQLENRPNLDASDFVFMLY